jgi:hypothetical protein
MEGSQAAASRIFGIDAEFFNWRARKTHRDSMDD